MRRDILHIIDRQVRRSQEAQRAARHVPGGREAEAEPRAVITISRQLGSGGRLVAQKLAERLGWGLWDKELVDAIAESAEVSRRIVEQFDERTVSEIELFVRSVAGETDVGGFIYRRQLARAVASIARHGNAVILGRGANFLLKGALNVRTVASEEVRVKNLMTFEGLTREEALEQMRRSDRERAAFVWQTFGKDLHDPLAYDLTITMDRFSIDGAVEIILSAPRGWEAPWPTGQGSGPE